MAMLLRSWLSVCACLALAVARVVAAPDVAREDDPAARLAALRAEIARHDALYFKQATPEISDAEYDRLKAELAALEQAHAALAAEAPALGAPDDRTGRFPTARHRAPMRSLDKIHDEAGWRAFHERVARAIGREDAAYVIEPKIDGIAIAVTYEHGRLVRAVTRGDGAEGDDITANIRTIAGLPVELADGEDGGVPTVVELRGEVFLGYAAFARINREREAAGEPLFANPRNAAAGTARLSDPAAVAGRGLEIVFFGAAAWEPATARPLTQQALLARLADWGLPVIEGVAVARGPDEVWREVMAMGEARTWLAYPTDGVVVKLDDLALRERCGEGPQAPRWAVACKFAPLRASTVVRAITVQVGRTGVLTPVAEFDPVSLAGSTVARASLHSREVQARMDVRVGDVVHVEKAGDIVPEIVGVDRARRPADSVPWVFPEACPSCQSPVAAAEGRTRVRCLNETCPGQVRRRLEHFASAAAVDIRGLGPATIDALVTRGWVEDPADLYHLGREQLIALGAAVETSADALLEAIERSRSAELWRVLHGLGIPRVGETTARNLATVYPSLGDLAELAPADFAPGGRAARLALGRATEEALVAWFADERHRALVRELVHLGVGARASSHRAVGVGREAVPGSAVAGKVFVLTGRLAQLERGEAIDRIRAAGGRVSASVSRRTDFLVAGEDPGAKLAQARELGVPVIDEAELLRMLATR